MINIQNDMVSLRNGSCSTCKVLKGSTRNSRKGDMEGANRLSLLIRCKGPSVKVVNTKLPAGTMGTGADLSFFLDVLIPFSASFFLRKFFITWLRTIRLFSSASSPPMSPLVLITNSKAGPLRWLLRPFRPFLTMLMPCSSFHLKKMEGWKEQFEIGARHVAGVRYGMNFKKDIRPRVAI
jgi:hypothetical protein